MKKKVNKEKSLNYGLRGLEISLSVLILLVVLFGIILFFKEGSISAVFSSVFRVPSEGDFMALLGGIIIFIALPFLIGIRIGLSIKSHFSKKKKKGKKK